jgi:uncharacterized protein (UPF0332 family)
MTAAQAYLKKAERSFQVADTLLKRGDADFAASRAYYGYFYTAQALLLVHGVPRLSRHGQLLAQYGLHFAKTQRLDPRFHQLLIRAFKTRELSDYEVGEMVDTEIVEELISEGFKFLSAATQYIEKTTDEAP